jgi:hypothetical protein
MIHLNMLGVPPAQPGAETRSAHPRIPLQIAAVREVKAPPVPRPLPGYLCEQCLDAPAVVVVPAPGGGEMGVCDACHQAPAVAALPLLTAAAGQQTIWHTIHDPERLTAYRATATVPLPAWWDRCVSTAPARVCACGSYRLRWSEDDEP